MPRDVELRVRILGALRAWCGEDEIALGPARQRAVFAVLAINAGRPVSRSELIAAVWGESPPASVEGNVHTYISGLRRSLDPGRSLLRSEQDGYSLRVAPASVDATVFERLVERANRHEDHHAVVADLDKALGLWQGDALSGVPGVFAEQYRERLAELRLNAIELRAEAVLASGAHLDRAAELAAELAVSAREHPLRERLRESLMLALYRSGRHTDALDVFRDARGTLMRELGVEPGPGLRRLHQLILTQDPALDPRVSRPVISVVPAHVTRALQPEHMPGPLFGRDREQARLRELVAEVQDGRGRAVWIEGEAGIGKSELLTRTLADVASRGCQLAWVAAGELSTRFPLQVVLECLAIDAKSPDPRRAGVAAALNGERRPGHAWGEPDPLLGAVERLLVLVDELCAQSPLVLVIDDLQWADESSMLVWHRLCAATRQLPLLLVASTRPVPDHAELGQLRRGVEARAGEVIDLVPLSESDTARLVEDLLGALPGPGLRELGARAAGNPLYVKEMIDVLIRAEAIEEIDRKADIDDSAVRRVPRSLIAAIGQRLDLLSDEAQEVLRWAALLGIEFAVGEIAAILGNRPSDLLAPLDEGLAANVLIDTGTQLAFRHPLLRQASYDRIPEATRPALHRRAAEALAGIGAPVERVAEQLAATPAAVDPWVLDWLADHHATVSNRAPLIAVELLERALAGCGDDDPRREVLITALVKVLFRLERSSEALARQAFAIARDPYNVAEMRQLLAVTLHRDGDTAAAVQTLGDAADDPAVPEIWRVRHRHLLANFRRGGLDDLDAAEAAAHEARASAAGEEYLTAHALQTLWLVSSIRRDHQKALRYIDEAIDIVGDGPELAGLRLDLLDNRVFTLQNLDRLTWADDTLREARELTSRHSLPTGLQVSVAVHHYWAGRWDEALVELDAVTEDGPAITFFGLREPGQAALLLYGVAALIAVRRDDQVQAAAHLDAAEEYAPATGAERESVDFLLVARALAAEQRGETEQALTIFEPILNPAYAPMMLRHQWLPIFVRLAVEAGDTAGAQRALEVCEAEAAKETVPARAFAAAAHCRGLISGDPGPLLATAAHYRDVGRIPELAAVLEDAAVVLTRTDRLDEAQPAFHESAELYTGLGARWDLRRAERRSRRLGVQRRAGVPEATPGSGWDSLSPLKDRIATLVAAGRSNPDIAAELTLPRRTVQAQVTRLLSKLEALSRAALADPVARQAGPR